MREEERNRTHHESNRTNAGQPSVISESAKELGMTHSMRPKHSEDIGRRMKTIKAPRSSDRGTFTALGATVGVLVTGWGHPSESNLSRQGWFRLGCCWAELGRRTPDCPQAIGRTECQQSAPAQSGQPSITKEDYPIGLQLGRDRHRHGRLPQSNWSCQ